MAVSIPAAAGLASAGASIFGGLTGKSPAKQVQLPQMFQMPNMPQAANAAFTDISGLPATGYGNMFLPQYEQATQNLINNPYAGQLQGGANTAAMLGTNAALDTFAGGQGITSAGQSLIPGAQAILGTAFDPQQAYYSRAIQQLQDQIRSGEAARGISTSPYGAGVENKALSDFGIDWMNTQLGRQIAGLGAAGTGVQQAGGAVSTGTGLERAAPGAFAGSAAMPYGAAQTIGRGQQQDISSLFTGAGQAQGLAQTPIQDYLAYIGAGNQAGGVANQLGQLGLNQAQLGFNQNQVLGGGLGAGLAGLSNQNNWNWLNSANLPGGVAQPGNTPFVPYGPGY